MARQSRSRVAGRVCALAFVSFALCASASAQETPAELIESSRNEAADARRAGVCDAQVNDVRALVRAHDRARAAVVREALEAKLIEVRAALRHCRATQQPRSQDTESPSLEESAGGQLILGAFGDPPHPAPPRPRRTQLASPTVSGVIPQTSVHRMLVGRQSMFRRCMEPPGSTRSGSLTLEFVIGIDGRIGRVRSASDSIGDAAISRCVAGVVQRLRFRRPDVSGTTHVSWTITLDPP